jgi:NTP pyrophosphatase (non-canonical NTP hydrolase)
MKDIINIEQLKKTLANFAKAREWEKFHTPKNLAMAIAGECGELLEIFQWLTAGESIHVKKKTRIKEQVSHELADIILYTIRMASLLDINLTNAVNNKLIINENKYPSDKVKGSAKKYTSYI